MYKNNILSMLVGKNGGGSGGNNRLNPRIFPYMKQEPEPIEYAEPQIDDTVTPPYAQPVDPMHGNAGAMAKYGRQETDDSELQRAMFSSVMPRPQMQPEVPSERPSYAQPPVLPHTLETPSMPLNANDIRNAIGARIADPDERELRLAEYDFQNPTDKDKGWKGRLGEIASNFLAGFGSASQGGDLWEKLGAGLGGAGGGAIDRTANERRAAGFQIPIIRDRINAKQQRDFVQARTDNIYADNARQKEALENEKLYKAGVLEQKNEAERNKAVTSIAKSPWFSKKNAAQVAQAKQAGLDPDSMAEWDFRNPVKTTINGTAYEFNRLNGEWEAAGLPPSEKDKIVPLSVRVPGEDKPRVFNVPQGQAATVAASLQAAGMQIEAATAAREDSQAHDLRRQRLAQQATKALEEYKAAEASGRQKERLAAAEKLAKLKAEYEGLIESEQPE